MSDKCADLNAR